MAIPIAIFCADIHLTLKQPVCRNDEDWMETQAFTLAQLTSLQSVLADVAGFLPTIICAGDIFDKWNVPPELITFAMRNLPKHMWAVPGQHDLPYHETRAMYKSGFGVLAEAERISVLGNVYIDAALKDVSIHGFGWNEEVMPPDKSFKSRLKVAVIHKYVWTHGHSYQGAPNKDHIFKMADRLKGYDVAVFGDNHKAFDLKLKTGTRVFNCGGFIRRKSDEIDSKPRVGILYDDGTIQAHYFHTPYDRFHKNAAAREAKAESEAFDMTEFLTDLESLGEQAADFQEAVRRYLRKKGVPKSVRSITLRALDV